MKLALKLIVGAFLVFAICLCCMVKVHADTPALVTGQALPASTAQDISKVFQDFGITVTPSGIIQLFAVLYFGAKLLRNKVLPQGSTVSNLLGSFLNFESTKPTPTVTITSPTTATPKFP